jgi:2-polyprenyl-6-hydroxyphenyl methylase/3-demethylubiquinone-9 3-methyltransferase
MNTLPAAATSTAEIAAGKRFAFGSNWAAFLESLDDERIATACLSLQEMLGVENLSGKRFVDIGSGSGLFSLAARRLGAQVYSFDYDPQSVACTEELRRRYFPSDGNWTVESGSALDSGYLNRLGKFDIVYSWGVLHHTGAMWEALANVAPLVEENGTLFIAIYNDQGRTSRRWLAVKRAYNRLPPRLRFLVLWPAFWHLWWRRIVKDFLLGRPFHTWRETKRSRGMSAWRDVIDWVGGYPFEVAKPEQIFDFFHARGFLLTRLKTDGGNLGCNQFVFVRGNRVPPARF